MSDISLLFFACLILSCIIVTTDSQIAGRNCAVIKPRNGRIKIRGRGRIAKFVCNPGYELVGKRIITCIRGHWNNPIPICVAPGCSMDRLRNGYFIPTHTDAFVNFYCDPGYKLNGSSSLYCDGRIWNSTIPNCEAAHVNPALRCDFEDPDLCGWVHDDQHEFEWTRHNFATPSGHVGTGPSHDHTLGEGSDGHYMYIEASSPRKENDTARLISPVYEPHPSSKMCFKFWYHMYGGTTGYLIVYVKPESKKLNEISSIFEKFGNQGNLWNEGVIIVPPMQENFQIIIEGVRGSSYVSDTAIDDVELSLDSECLEDKTVTIIDEVTTDVASFYTMPTHSTPPPEPTPTSVATTVTTTKPTTSPTTTFTTQTQTPTTRSIPKSTTRPVTSTTVKTSTKTTLASTISSETSAFTQPLSTTAVRVETTTSRMPLPRTIFPRKTTTLIPEQVQRAEKRSEDVTTNNAASSSVIAVLVLGGVLLISIAIGGVYFLHRRRQMHQKSLADDSDVRYLKDEDIQLESDSGL